MYATIRRYEGVDGTGEEFVTVLRKIAYGLSGVPGFVSFVVIESRPNDIVTVSIFDDQVGLNEADRRVEASLADHWATLPVQNPKAVTGEIMFQRGL